MMGSTRYRLGKPTLGLQSVDRKRYCMTVPAGATIEIPVDGFLNNHRTVEVRWQDYVLTMFSDDVRERSVALENTEPDLGGARPVNTAVAKRHP